MAQYGEEVERCCGVKVIDPAPLALACAELAARLNLCPSRRSVAAYRQEVGRLMDCVELLEQMVSIPSESQNEEAFARFLCSYLHDRVGDGKRTPAHSGEEL